MVKGENDIVRDWVIYHGNLFGFKNLFVIDNYSQDGTWEILQEFRGQVNLFRLHDYKKKGIYMTMLLKKFCKNEIVFPIDIDEFIVLYDIKTNSISCNNNLIHNCLKKLPTFPIFKMNYINSLLLDENGYKRATVECKLGNYIDYGSGAKTFFNSRLFKGEIDHGNHYATNEFILSSLCLVHFHHRNLLQMKKKIFNNVKGLGYNPFSIEYLEKILQQNPNSNGSHHIVNQIEIIKNQYKLPLSNKEEKNILLNPLNAKINFLTKKIYQEDKNKE